MFPLPQRRSDVSLAPFTTFGIGGPAAELIETDSGELLGEIAEDLGPDAEINLIGGGSNVVIADRGLGGTTILLRRPAGRYEPRVHRDGLAELDGADDWPSAADAFAARGLQGTESMSGIPGTVGGAVVQNIGAYGYELADLIHEVRAFDRIAGRRVALGAEDCGFGYRTSRFKAADRGRHLILGVTLRLTPRGRHRVRYDELAGELGGETSASPADVRRAVLAIRERKAMVYHPGDPATRGVGSFFTNPVVTTERYVAVADRVRAPVPHWPIDDQRVKLSAGWLIEHAGWARGHRSGNVGLSERHALAILNVTGKATAAEVIEFAGTIRARVHEVHGVLLAPEPVFLGFPDDEVWSRPRRAGR